MVTMGESDFASRPTRNTDVRSSAGDVERRELAADDLRALQDVLATLKALDPNRKRITLVPGLTTPRSRWWPGWMP